MTTTEQDELLKQAFALQKQKVLIADMPRAAGDALRTYNRNKRAEQRDAKRRADHTQTTVAWVGGHWSVRCSCGYSETASGVAEAAAIVQGHLIDQDQPPS